MRKNSGCFKYGCFGCVSLGAVAVALIFGMSALRHIVEPEDSKIEQHEAQHPLPPVTPRTPATDVPNAFPDRLDLPDGEAQTRGRIVLDMSLGEFVIRPGAADEPLRVEADYDSAHYRLSEEFTESSDSGWTYTVGFGSRRSLLGMIFGRESDNRVELIIPRGHPVDIVGKIGIGESNVDLSGLWVGRLDLELGIGDHFFEVREPQPFPMDSFRLEASIGELEVRNLGEASPARVEVSQDIGELFLDLKGTWRQDATIDVELGIGESRLWVPEDVLVELEGVSMSIGDQSVDLPDPDEVPEGAPTLTVEMSGNIGELTIER